MRSFKVRYRALRSKISSLVRINRSLRAEAVRATVQRIYWSAPALAIASLLVALIFGFKEEAPFSVEAKWRMYIMLTHVGIGLINLLIWVVAGKLKDRASTHTLFIFQVGVTIYVLGAGILITTIDQLVLTGSSPYLISSMLVAALYFFRPGCSALIFFLSFLAYHFCMMRFANLPLSIFDSGLTNGLFASTLGFVFSALSWRNFRTTKLQKAKIAEQRDILEQMAYQDPLTHLPNRRLLDELVRREIDLVQRQKVESCLIIIDLDSFKEVNDNYGHPVGDAVLQQLAQMLQKSMAGSNTLVRLGGEEFVILASNTSLDEARALAERLRQQIEEHEFSVGKKKIYITASFGVAPLRGTEQAGDYYALADKALYRAKQQGKNRVAV